MAELLAPGPFSMTEAVAEDTATTLPDALLRDRLITHVQHSQILSELALGSSLLSSLAHNSDQTAVWTWLARMSGRTLFQQDQQVCLLGYLLPFRTALTLGALPLECGWEDLTVLSYDHELPDEAVCGLGDIARLRRVLVTPARWRDLFDLTYPAGLLQHQGTALDLEDAYSLVTLRRRGQRGDVTQEQQVAIQALVSGHRAINPLRQPPEADALSSLTPGTMQRLMAVPYRYEGDRLLVLVGDPGENDILGELERVTLGPVTLAMATLDHLQQVIDRLQREVVMTSEREPREAGAARV